MPGAQWLAQHLLARQVRRGRRPRTRRRAPSYVMASTPGLRPEPDREAERLREDAGDEEPVPARAGGAAPQPRHAGPLPAGLDFKTITAAAALDDGVYKPDSTFDDPGYCTEYGKQVKNALDQSGPEAFGTVNLVEAYQHSINAVFCNIGKKLGAKRILDEAKKFGFYSVPPLEMPGDARSASGLYLERQALRPDDRAAASRASIPGRLAFGQDKMLTTPLQMAMVAAAVANKGVEMQPTLIKQVLAPGGSVIKRLHPQVLPAGDEAVDRRRAEEHDGRGRPGGHRDRRRRSRASSSPARPGPPRRARAIPSTTPGSSSSPRPTTRSSPVPSSSSIRTTASAAPIAAPIAKQLMQAILPTASNSELGTLWPRTSKTA